MGWIDARLGTLEARFEALRRQVGDILTQLKAVAQTARNAYQQQGGNPNPTSGTYIAYPTSIILANSSASLQVSQIAGGTATVIGTFDCINYTNSATTAGNGTSTFALILIPDGIGTYTIVSQACA